jgi:hypothetical protein
MFQWRRNWYAMLEWSLRHAFRGSNYEVVQGRAKRAKGIMIENKASEKTVNVTARPQHFAEWGYIALSSTEKWVIAEVYLPYHTLPLPPSMSEIGQQAICGNKNSYCKSIQITKIRLLALLLFYYRVS